MHGVPFARLTTHHTIIWRSVALIATQKKTHGASYVADNILGFHARLPILRQRKNYIRKCRKKASQKKGVFAERASSCVVPRLRNRAMRPAIHAVTSECSQATFLPPRLTCGGNSLTDEFIDGRVVTGRTGASLPADVKTLLRDVRQRHQWRHRGGRRGRKQFLHRATPLMSIQHRISPSGFG